LARLILDQVHERIPLAPPHAGHILLGGKPLAQLRIPRRPPLVVGIGLDFIRELSALQIDDPLGNASRIELLDLTRREFTSQSGRFEDIRLPITFPIHLLPLAQADGGTGHQYRADDAQQQGDFECMADGITRHGVPTFS
jgi:hypothetical protein